MTQPSGILEEMTIDQVRQLDPQVVVLPIGSTEPHGPHLPYGTDTYQVDAICRSAVIEANRAGASALMYPPLPISNNVNFKAFPFACRIGVRTLMTVLGDIITELEEDGIRKIVIVNGHGGNTDTLKAALREHAERHPPDEGAFVCLAGGMGTKEAAAMIEHPSDHAGEAETSQMLHLRPDLVQKDKFDAFPVGTPNPKALQSRYVHFVRPWHGHVPTSAGGETRTSSEAKGKALIESAAAGLADFLVELSQAQWRPGFPY